VAIAVLSLSILGTFTAVQSGLQKSVYVKNQTVAFYLVQEAMEYIHNIRDENAIWSINEIMAGRTARDWLYGLSATGGEACYFGKVCSIDSALHAVADCSGSCAVLNQNSGTSLFGYTSGGGWSATHFKREIVFGHVAGSSDAREVWVTVTVTWDGNTFQVKQLFMNNR
jgi:hypothetical protein